MRIIAIMTILLLLSYQQQQKGKTKKEETGPEVDSSFLLNNKKNSAITNSDMSPSSFLDSIVGKFELSITQIQKYTMIDSVYYTGRLSEAVFTGDTIFNFYNGFKGAIINYSDRISCAKKLLLVLSSANGQNTDNKEIYTDCDHDGESEFEILRYKLLNDSIFETLVQIYSPANGETRLAKRFKWKVNNSGIIDSIR